MPLTHTFISAKHGRGKVVRDLIETGKQLDSKEAEAALRVKVREEVEEFLEPLNSNAELADEAADLVEAVNALLVSRGISIDQWLEAAEAKRAKKGAFELLMFLPMPEPY